MKKKAGAGRQQGVKIPVRALFGILFFLMMIGTIVLICLLNTIFLEKYYIDYRKNALVRVYHELQSASVQDLLGTDDFDRSLHSALRSTNTNLLVMDSGTRTVKAWSADESVMEERLYANIFSLTPKEGEDSAKSPYLITQILKEEQSYTIQIVLDRRAGARSMEMWGPLGENCFFLLRSPLEDIRSSAAVANRFFAYTGVVVAIAGAALAWWLSRRITEPIRQLTDISVRMKELDFSAKYEGGNHSELDILGRNMNELSQKLEETISALRTANNDLQRDLDRRNRQEEMRQDFLSNVTHELKTPIALIRGYAEGLQDGIAEDPESRAFYLDTIVDESDKMNTIVQKVLMLNSLEFGDGSVSMERFDLVGMIRNYLGSAAILAQQEGITLLFEQKDPLYAWGDPFLIQEVFQNYYSNAVHYVEAVPAREKEPPGEAVPAQAEEFLREENSARTAADGGEAKPEARDDGEKKPEAGDTGETRPEARDGGETRPEAGDTGAKTIEIRCVPRESLVRVTVFNTGKPIPEESLPRIWEKFYKVDKARTRTYGGSGVGLSIVKAIMELHHRGYGVENYSNGVAFWFELDQSGPSGERN